MARSLLKPQQQDPIKTLTILIQNNHIRSAITQTKSLLTSKPDNNTCLLESPCHLYQLLSLSSPFLTSSFSSLLITTCAHLKTPNPAFAILTLIHKTHHPFPSPTSLYLLLQTLVNLKQYPLALSLFCLIGAWGIKPVLFAYNMAIQASVKMGELDEALSLIREMEEVDGILPGNYAYSVMISGLWKGRRGVDADRLFDEMLKSGMVPLHGTYNNMICGYCRDGRFCDAFRVKERMLCCGLKLDRKTYNSMVGCLCRSGRMLEAEELVEEMRNNGVYPNVETFNSLIKGYIRIHKMERFSGIVEEMEHKDGVEPNEETFGLVMDAMFRVGKIAEAETIFLEMMARDISPSANVFNVLVDAYSKSRSLHRAYKLVDIVKKGFLRCSAL